MSNTDVSAIESQVVLCDRTDAETGQTCGAKATAQYLFDWGEGGNCCAKHQMLLNQTAQNVARGITFMALAQSLQVALTRDERTNLIAAKMSADIEATELRQQMQLMYQELERARGDMRILAAQKASLEATNVGLAKEHEAAARAAGEALARLSEVEDELRRFRRMAPTESEIANTLHAQERVQVLEDALDVQVRARNEAEESLAAANQRIAELEATREVIE